MAEPPYLAAVRQSYDTVAADYVKLVKTPEAMDPLGRAMLNAFAELVQGAGRGRRLRARPSDGLPGRAKDYPCAELTCRRR